MKLTASILLLVTAIVVVPLALIWALNTLFPTLEIPLTFETWLAASILSTPFSTANRIK